MKRYKKKYNMYSAWNYEQEVLDLNAQSEKGWQLVKGKSFSHKYEYNPEVCYRYQLDYLPGLSGTPEKFHLLDVYKEQGWEFVNKTFNGWYYFRKIYDPALPDAEYELYTDRSSLQEMQGRWAKIATSCAIMIGFFFLCWTLRFFAQPCLPFFLGALTFGFDFFVFLRAIIMMRNPDKPKANKADCIFTALFFIILFAGLGIALTLLANRPYISQTSSSYYENITEDFERSTQINSFTVSYPDRYYLNLDIDSDAPLCFTIRNKAGESVYSINESETTIDNLALRLKKGEYEVYISDFSEGQTNISYRLQ